MILSTTPQPATPAGSLKAGDNWDMQVGSDVAVEEKGQQ